MSNTKNTQVRVRFAPSPTGDLHVGGVRTALFNWLYARSKGGKFLLRIEDTDVKRSTKEAIQVILDGLEWLGIQSDEEIVYQSQRIDRHQDAVKKLLANNSAYRCFCSPEEIRTEREACEKAKVAYAYDRKCDRLSEEEIQSRLDSDQPFTVRLRIPEEVITYNDGVHGDISVAGKEIDDFILLRSNGTPVYMIAVVVDDADMGVTHIIRGDDHVSNTPKQVLLYRALGYDVPDFSHVPLILGTDKKRLSKRHGATSITAYQDMGLSSEAIINYLGLLGWSPGDEREKMSPQELIDAFNTSGINSKSAVFDEKKLLWLNGYYISETDYSDVADQLKVFAEQAIEKGILKSIPSEELTVKAWNLLKNRIHILSDLFVWGRYFFQNPEEYDKKGVKKHFKAEDVPERLNSISDDFAALDVFDFDTIENYLREKAESLDVNAAKLIHPIRLSVSGTTGGPGLFEMLEALGRDVVVSRLRTASKAIQDETIKTT